MTEEDKGWKGFTMAIAEDGRYQSFQVEIDLGQNIVIEVRAIVDKGVVKVGARLAPPDNHKG